MVDFNHNTFNTNPNNNYTNYSQHQNWNNDNNWNRDNDWNRNNNWNNNHNWHRQWGNGWTALSYANRWYPGWNAFNYRWDNDNDCWRVFMRRGNVYITVIVLNNYNNHWYNNGYLW